METKLYAAYGSNMNLEQMSIRCPQARVVGKGELHGYKLTFRGLDTGFANVELSDKASVPIVLWQITKECEVALDSYEDYPMLYIKKTVKITTNTGEQEAMLYVMVKQYEGMTVMPNKHYFEIIRQGYQDNGINTAPLDEALEITETELGY